MKKILLIFIVFVFLNGCKTLPNPDVYHNTLLIGQLVYTGNNFKGEYWQLNGIHKGYFEITLKDKLADKIYVLEGGLNGVFFSVNIPSGQYIMKKFYVKIGVNGYFASTSMELLSMNNFVIVKDKVNNLGVINWNYTCNENSVFYANKEYDQAFQFFSSQYPNSAWLKKEWISVQFTNSDTQIHKEI